jgi:regulator of sirC expression with transglutaminase-like and TPR domain
MNGSDEVRALFEEEVTRGPGRLDLARASLLVAREEYPQLSCEQYLGRLDALAEEVHDRLGVERAPLVVLRELVATLHERHSFRGNVGNYHDPRNSFLNDVLDRQLGIPLTLSIVTLEVGWRLGMPLEGVNFPAHFLVRYRGEAVQLLVDPFRGGEIRFQDQAQELLDRLYGGMVRLRPGFLQRADPEDMLVRLLGNLKAVYLNRRDDHRALSAVERLLLLRPGAPVEIRDRGILLVRLGRSDEAMPHLEGYLAAMPEAGDAERILRMLERIRRGDPPGPEAPPGTHPDPI